jgi:hypothetical protein
VLREHAANDILVNLDAEDMRELLGNAHTAKLGIAGLQLNDRRDEFCGRTFGAGFAARRRRGKEQAVLCATSAKAVRKGRRV